MADTDHPRLLHHATGLDPERVILRRQERSYLMPWALSSARAPRGDHQKTGPMATSLPPSAGLSHVRR